MSDMRLLGEGSYGHAREGVGVVGSLPIERRRNERSGDSPMDVLTGLPAVVVLERISVPTIAVARDGHHLVRKYGVCRDGGVPAGRLSGFGVR